MNHTHWIVCCPPPLPCCDIQVSAVLKVVHLIVEHRDQQSHSGFDAHTLKRIFVPDEYCVLRPATLLVLKDDDWVASRVDLSRMTPSSSSSTGLHCRQHYAHPSLSAAVCARLGIPGLTRLVKEVVELGSTLDVFTAPSAVALADELTATLADHSSRDALARIAVDQARRAVLSGGSGRSMADSRGVGSSGDGSSSLPASLSGDSYPAVLSRINSVLTGVKVKLVESLVTRFHMAPTVSGSSSQSASNEVDVTRSTGHVLDAVHDAFFLNESGREIVVACNGVSSSYDGVSLIHMVAKALVQMLDRVDVTIHDALPVATVLQAKGGARAMEALAGLRMGTGTTGGSATADGGEGHGTHLASRGVPGVALTTHDQARVELAPFKEFARGEVVAVEAVGLVASALKSEEAGDVGAGGVSSDMRGHKSVRMAYGVVIQGTESRETSQVLQRIRVRVSVDPVREEDLLTTECYTFKSATAISASSTTTTSRGSSAELRQISRGAATSEDNEESGLLLGMGDGVDRGDEGEVGVQMMAMQAGQTGRGEGLGTSSSAAAVSRDEIVQVVKSLLERADLQPTMEQEGLLQDNMRIAEERKVARKEADHLRDQVKALSEELDKLRAHQLCQICFTKDVDRVLVPCGHLLCHGCVEQLPQNGRACPFDRARIERVMKHMQA
jgi:hypothetical protein